MKFTASLWVLFFWIWGCATPKTHIEQPPVQDPNPRSANPSKNQPRLPDQEGQNTPATTPRLADHLETQANNPMSLQEIESLIKTFQKERQVKAVNRDTAWERFLPPMFTYVQQDIHIVRLAPLIQARITIEFELDADIHQQRASKRLINQVARLISWIDLRVQTLRNQSNKSQSATLNDADLELSWPLQRGQISSSYGYRPNPFQTQQIHFHAGIDLSAPANEPIYSVAEGVVVQTGWHTTAGRRVKIQHSQDLISTYCHLQKISVRTGQHVAKGERIGFVGSSGRATGPHLHFSLSIKGKSVDPLNHLEPIPLHFSDSQHTVEFGFAP